MSERTFYYFLLLVLPHQLSCCAVTHLEDVNAYIMTNSESVNKNISAKVNHNFLYVF
jgi:hypothetical protein